MTGHRFNAQGGRFQHEVGRGYQTASRNAGRWDRRTRFTWGQIAILAYCFGLTTGVIGTSLYLSKAPPTAASTDLAPSVAETPTHGAVEAGAMGNRGAGR